VVSLRVIILTWEFPPRIVGEISSYTDRLAAELTKRSVEVHVVTYHEAMSGLFQAPDGVKIYRIQNPVETHFNVVTWDLTLSVEFERVLSNIYYQNRGEIDLIDAHEWLCSLPSLAAKRWFDINLVWTAHSLEDQRSASANAPLNIAIKNLELLAAQEADRVIVKSEFVKAELTRVYGVPDSKIDLVQPSSPTWIDEVMNSYKKAAI